MKITIIFDYADKIHPANYTNTNLAQEKSHPRIARLMVEYVHKIGTILALLL